MDYSDPLMVGEVPTYEDLRKIEDWSVDRGRNVTDKFTEYDLLQYSINREMYSGEDIRAKFANPSEDPELGVELMDGPEGSLKWAQLLLSGFAGAAAGAATGDWLSGYASFIGTYVLSEAGVRGAGYAWAKGRDREDIRNNPLSPYDEEKEDALKELVL